MSADPPVAPDDTPTRLPLSARWQELFWALPPGELRHKLRTLEIDTGAEVSRLREALQLKNDALQTSWADVSRLQQENALLKRSLAMLCQQAD